MPSPADDRLPEKLSDASLRRRRRRMQRQEGEFVKGPIPTTWIKRAAQLPGKALAVGMTLWFQVGVCGRKEDLPVTSKLVVAYGVSRKARYRAIAALERAHLIRVDRRRGRCPRVTLLVKKGTRSIGDGGAGETGRLATVRAG